MNKDEEGGKIANLKQKLKRKLTIKKKDAQSPVD